MSKLNPYRVGNIPGFLCIQRNLFPLHSSTISFKMRDSSGSSTFCLPFFWTRFLDAPLLLRFPGLYPLPLKFLRTGSESVLPFLQVHLSFMKLDTYIGKYKIYGFVPPRSQDYHAGPVRFDPLHGSLHRERKNTPFRGPGSCPIPCSKAFGDPLLAPVYWLKNGGTLATG